MGAKHLVVTGIGTGIGKTICSAVLAEALKADYWKPIQSGDLHELDSDLVRRVSTNCTIIPERLLLRTPVSPHEAARIDRVELTEDDFELPVLNKTTIIEGAGGVMVPLNEAGLTYLDIFQMWDLPIVVVTRHYLGSINHTLLTLNALYQRELKIHALIINGPRLESTERIYRAQFPEIKMHFIPEMEEITTSSISKAAEIWNEQQR